MLTADSLLSVWHTAYCSPACRCLCDSSVLHIAWHTAYCSPACRCLCDSSVLHIAWHTAYCSPACRCLCDSSVLHIAWHTAYCSPACRCLCDSLGELQMRCRLDSHQASTLGLVTGEAHTWHHRSKCTLFRIWFPAAKAKSPVQHIAGVLAMAMTRTSVAGKEVRRSTALP